MTEPTKKQLTKKVKIYPYGTESTLASKGASVSGGKDAEVIITYETLSNGDTKITASTKDGKPVNGIILEDNGAVTKYENGVWNQAISFGNLPTPSKSPSSSPFPSPKPTSGNVPAPNVAPGSYGSVSGAYGSQATSGAFYNNWSPDTSVYTDPSTGVQVSGAGTVPTKNGPKTISQLMMEARNPKNLGAIRKLLVTNGIISEGTKSFNSIQNAWLGVLINSASSNLDPQEYIKQARAAGIGQDIATTASKYPTRSIYQYTPEQLGSKIDEVAQNILGRGITDADKAASWYQNLNKTLNDMVMQGTVTPVTKLVKNPKTGQMENVSIQKPEVTSEGITQKITGALEAADPESLARKQRIDFTKWLYGQMGFSG